MEFLIADQRIGYIAERALDGLPVGDQCLLVLRLSQSQIPAQGSAGENGLAHLGAVGPDSESANSSGRRMRCCVRRRRRRSR